MSSNRLNIKRLKNDSWDYSHLKCKGNSYEMRNEEMRNNDYIVD